MPSRGGRAYSVSRRRPFRVATTAAQSSGHSHQSQSPSGLALDPSAGQVYWSDSGARRIQRADLDGSGVEDLVTRGLRHPLGLAVDTATDRIYWTTGAPTASSTPRLDGATPPDPTWQHLLGWSNFRFWLIPPEPYHWYGGYLGVSLCAMALAGGVALLRRREERFAACWVCLILTLLVVFAYRLPPISSLPLIHSFNASRYLLFVAFFLALAAGIGAHMLLQQVPEGLARSRRCTLLLLAMGFDLFPTTFIQPYYPSGNYVPTGWRPESFAEVTEAASPFDERKELPNYRAHWIGEGVYPYKRRAQMLYMGRTPIAETFHPGELRTMNTFVGPFTDWAHQWLPEMESVDPLLAHTDLDPLMAGFQLLNTRHVMATSNKRRSGFAFSLENSPIVVSGRLAGYDEVSVDLAGVTGRFGEDLEDRVARMLWIIQRTGVHPGGGRSCERILVRGVEGERDLGTTPTAQVLAHRVDHQQVEMRVAVSATCHARLAYGYWPYLQVTVDGTPVQPMETAGRFMAIPLEAGEHDIAIRARLSPLRKGLVLLSGVCLAAALALVIRSERHDR